MKKYLTSNFLLAGLILTQIISCKEDSNPVQNQKGWYSLNSGVGMALNSIYFLDQNKGWVVGYSGVILNTNDAGNTWNEQNSNTNNTLNSVKFLDTAIGYVAGNSGTILKTTNGGSTWFSLQSNVNSNLSAIDMYSRDTGIVTGWFSS